MAAAICRSRSIAHGGPVTSLGSAKLHFAPGYPLLASLGFLIDDHPFLLLSILQWLLAVVFMLGVYRWSKRILPGAELWITALTMVNASLWMHVRLTISEAAFMAALIWTVEALHELAAAVTTRELCQRAALAAVMTLIVAMVRQVGVLVVGGYALAMLVAAWKQQIRWSRALITTLAVGVPASLAILALMAYERGWRSWPACRTGPTSITSTKPACRGPLNCSKACDCGSAKPADC